MANYIFKILAHASLGKMREAVKTVHERSGKNSVKIFFDMLYCAKKYGAGFLLFTAICKASSDNHFAILPFFSLGIFLNPASCKMS